MYAIWWYHHLHTKNSEHQCNPPPFFLSFPDPDVSGASQQIQNPLLLKDRLPTWRWSPTHQTRNDRLKVPKNYSWAANLYVDGQLLLWRNHRWCSWFEIQNPQFWRDSLLGTCKYDWDTVYTWTKLMERKDSFWNENIKTGDSVSVLNYCKNYGKWCSDTPSLKHILYILLIHADKKCTYI